MSESSAGRCVDREYMKTWLKRVLFVALLVMPDGIPIIADYTLYARYMNRHTPRPQHCTALHPAPEG